MRSRALAARARSQPGTDGRRPIAVLRSIGGRFLRRIFRDRGRHHHALTGTRFFRATRQHMPRAGRWPQAVAYLQSYPAAVFSYLLLTEYLQLQSAANTQATHVLRPAPKRDDEAGAQEARVAIAFCLVESRWSPCTRALVGARHETTQRALWPAVTGQKEDRRDN